MSQQKKYSVKKVLLWYWRTIPRYRPVYLALFGLYGTGILAANVISPIFYKRIVDVLAQPSPDLALVWQAFGILGAIFFFYFVLFRIGDVLYARVEINGTRDLSRFVFKKLQDQSYEFFTKESAGSLIAKSSRFIGAYEDLLSDIFFAFWFNGLQFFGMLVVLYIINPFLASLILFWSLVSFGISYPFLTKSWKYDNLHSIEDSKVTERKADVITNALTVKIFSAFKREEKEFEKATDREAAAHWKSWLAFIYLSAVQNGLVMMLQLGGIALSIWLWYSGEISIGTVVLVLTYLLGMFEIIWNISRTINRFIRHLARASEMIEIFERTPTVLDLGSHKSFTVTKGGIEFQNVTFGYREGKSVFRDFTLSVRPGEKVGLVGPSGAGKSTITKLLLRFFDPQEGKILIDGQDIKEVGQDDLRRAIGYVPQEALLFHRPIGENIAYGKENATQTEIEQAARKAEAHEFIDRLAKKYETLVGDRGVKLSGGERQRVAIARAILKNAPILILDEATSSLDSASEVAIKKALDELMKGKTAIVIAHRLSTIQKMDRIVVLNKQGGIEEMGTHSELLAHNGLYANLWNHQAGGFIDEDAIE